MDQPPRDTPQTAQTTKGARCRRRQHLLRDLVFVVQGFRRHWPEDLLLIPDVGLQPLLVCTGRYCFWHNVAACLLRLLLLGAIPDLAAGKLRGVDRSGLRRLPADLSAAATSKPGTLDDFPLPCEYGIEHFLASPPTSQALVEPGVRRESESSLHGLQALHELADRRVRRCGPPILGPQLVLRVRRCNNEACENGLLHPRLVASHEAHLGTGNARPPLFDATIRTTAAEPRHHNRRGLAVPAGCRARSGR
mmetsp:Transcript_133329/g.385896  ORF Transcript_133329/g.385896 Transcript_133329/m.385896 type:complete len:250 (-) Transcript_133329:231-980(-)